MSAPKGATELLNPGNCVIAFIDHQPQMLFGVEGADRQALVNNVVALAKAARVFEVPVVLTSVETKSFSGNLWPALVGVFPGERIVERSSMNSWEDRGFVDAVKATGRRKLVLAGLWTEVCVAFPALSALQDGYEVYVVVDASAGGNAVAHETAILRMVQAGVVPVTWQQVMLEFQRDWSRKETYDPVLGIVKEHSGAYGSGVEYAYTMVHRAPATVVRS
ncbi:MAG: hydrolase [Planctomycetaceae bacterium]|nr:hydrolase [Planctomycetota bacterium]NUN52078.1 hydrolase [Planctomycetaceae bacterium]